MAYSKAVNRPVDEKLKERDINNKLQLYGMYNGKSQAKFRFPSLVSRGSGSLRVQVMTEAVGNTFKLCNPWCS